MTSRMLRKVVNIIHDITNNGVDWEENILVPFVPDYVILRQVTYSYDDSKLGAAYNIQILRTNLVDDRYGITMIGKTPFNSNPQTIFTLGQPINGSYRFSLTFFDLTLSDYAGNLALQLEFIKENNF